MLNIFDLIWFCHKQHTCDTLVQILKKITTATFHQKLKPDTRQPQTSQMMDMDLAFLYVWMFHGLKMCMCIMTAEKKPCDSKSVVATFYPDFKMWHSMPFKLRNNHPPLRFLPRPQYLTAPLPHPFSCMPD